MNDKCKQCRGACCEVVKIDAPTPDYIEWIEGRAVKLHGGTALLPCICRHLTDDGKCDIQASKPLFCQNMEVGGTDCQTIVRLLRPSLAKNWGWL